MCLLILTSVVYESLATIFTARRRSLGQGNVFTGVCLSTGGLPIPPHWMQTKPPQRQTPWMQTFPPVYGQQAGGTHPTGMQTCQLCASVCSPEPPYIFTIRRLFSRRSNVSFLIDIGTGIHGNQSERVWTYSWGSEKWGVRVSVGFQGVVGAGDRWGGRGPMWTILNKSWQ